MKYEKLSVTDQLTGLRNRIRQLEEEHYSNSVFAFECEVVGELETLKAFEDKNKGIEKRISALKVKASELEATLPEEQSENDDTV